MAGRAHSPAKSRHLNNGWADKTASAIYRPTIGFLSIPLLPSFVSSFLPLIRHVSSWFRISFPEYRTRGVHIVHPKRSRPKKTTGIAINEKPCVESRPVQRFAILFAVFVDLSRNACRASIDRFALNVFLEEEFELGDKFGKGSFSFCRKRLEETRGWLSRKF